MIYWEKPSKKCKNCIAGTIDKVELTDYHDGTCDISVALKLEKDGSCYIHFQSFLLPKHRKDLKEYISAYLTDLCDNITMCGETVKTVEEADAMLFDVPVLVFKDKGNITQEIASDARRSFSAEKFKKHHPEFYAKKDNKEEGKEF